ncbi:MAG: hypothetical protein ABIS07_14160, partial [Dokdonella sp.]
MTNLSRQTRRCALAAGILASLLATPLFARQLPQNLGYGLDKLVESDVALRSGHVTEALHDGYTTQAAADYAARAIKDAATGRVLVDITLNGRVPFSLARDALAAKVASLSIQATDATYRRTGIIEAYVAVADVPTVAQSAGVKSVFLALRPDVD